MCKLAANLANSNPHTKTHVIVEVSDMELTRTGPSYTIDTVRSLRQNGWPQVHWLIGADMLNYLPKWHKHIELIQETQFVVMARPFVEIHWASLPGELAHLKDTLVPAPLIEISSTDIRQRVRQGRSIDYLTPQPVVDYIFEKNLYCT
jgi:nicotinate-nucleotide adenylyltransferase